MELANLQFDLEAAERFQERFADFIPPFDDSWLAKYMIEDAMGGETPLPTDPKQRNKILNEALEDDAVVNKAFGTMQLITRREIRDGYWILELNKLLRILWTEPDLRQKEWGVFVIRYLLYNFGRKVFSEGGFLTLVEDPAKALRIPPPSPFEQALNYLVKAADKARYCANPECPAPYFFVQRRNQRYCSEICAAPAQRELKRQWWAEHGEEWRAARQAKKSGKRGSSKGKSGQKSKQTTKKRGN